MGQTIAESIWEEGRAEGERKALRRTQRRALTERFGGVPEAIATRIEACSDVERLTAAIIQVLHIATPDGGDGDMPKYYGAGMWLSPILAPCPRSPSRCA